MDYASAPVHKTFVQQTKRVVHEEIDSRKVKVRECRDSDNHPRTVPIILALDVTGSMGSIPKQLIADGLPTLMSSIIQGGCVDAALLFLAIGDHEYDRYPVQFSQFESGDAELDMLKAQADQTQVNHILLHGSLLQIVLNQMHGIDVLRKVSCSLLVTNHS